MAGERWLSIPGAPRLPYLTHFFPNRFAQKGRVIFSNLQAEKNTPPAPLELAPPIPSWGTEEAVRFDLPPGNLFPPSPYEVREKRGEEGGTEVTVFPLQWERSTGNVWKLRSLTVEFILPPSPFRRGTEEGRGAEESGDGGLILTVEKLREAAEKLQRFHQERLGLSSAIVTAEELSNEPLLSEAELPEGYKDRALGDKFVLPYKSDQRGFDYETSLKIQHYLHGRIGQEPLRYLVLLGGASEIPPSYYFSVTSLFQKKLGVTDLCYGALRRCTDFRVAVGRLPFSSTVHFDDYLTKSEKWLSFASHPFQEVALAGGKAFPNSNVFLGELATLSLLELPDANWWGVEKLLRTHQAFTRQNILDIFSGKSAAPLAYLVDHGDGNRLKIDDSFVSTNDLAVLRPATEGLGKGVPVVVSVGCANAAFDEPLLKKSVLGSPSFGTLSFGEALLRSPVGAVAYIGANRDSIGSPEYSFDEFGNLDFRGTTYFLRLLDLIFQSYLSQRTGRIGDYFLSALKAYAAETSGAPVPDPHTWTMLSAELLGDPTLPFFSNREASDKRSLPTSKTRFDGMGERNYPVWSKTKHSEVAIDVEREGPIRSSLFRITGGGFQGISDKLLERKDWSNDDKFFAENFDPGSYLLTLENKKGVPRERQLWFQVGP